MEGKVVFYDETESLWNFGKLISKFPDEMLSHSLVFESHKNLKSKQKDEFSEISKLKKNHKNDILLLKRNHSKEMNEIKKKSEEDIQFWKDNYLYVKQYLEIILRSNLHQI